MDIQAQIGTTTRMLIRMWGYTTHSVEGCKQNLSQTTLVRLDSQIDNFKFNWLLSTFYVKHRDSPRVCLVLIACFGFIPQLRTQFALF